jgi:hypothetical protein
MWYLSNDVFTTFEVIVSAQSDNRPIQQLFNEVTHNNSTYKRNILYRFERESIVFELQRWLIPGSTKLTCLFDILRGDKPDESQVEYLQRQTRTHR